MTNRILKKMAFAAGIAMLMAGSANAGIVGGDIIAIDFGGTPTAVANYNDSNFASTDVANLIRLSDGAATMVGLTVVGAIQDNSNNVAGNLGNMTDADIFEDGLLATNNQGSTSLTLTFSGLDDSLTYDLLGGLARAASQNNPQNFASNWSVGGSTAFSDGQAGAGYVSFTGLTSSGGDLVVTIDGTNNFSPVSQLELSASASVIPEPSSLALLAAGFGMIGLRRRR